MVRKIKFSNITLLLILLVFCIIGGLFVFYLHKSIIFESFDTAKSINIEYYYNSNDSNTNWDIFYANWDTFVQMITISNPKKLYTPIKYDMTSDIGKTRITKFNITNSPTVIITDINDNKIGQEFNDYNANDVSLALILYADSIVTPSVSGNTNTPAYESKNNVYKWCRCSNSDDNPFNN